MQPCQSEALDVVCDLYRDLCKLEVNANSDLAETRLLWARVLGQLHKYFPERQDLLDVWRSTLPNWPGSRVKFLDIHVSEEANRLLYPEGDYGYRPYPDYVFAYDEFSEADDLFSLIQSMQISLLEILAWIEAGARNDELPMPRVKMPDLGFIDDRDLRRLCSSRFREACHNYDTGAYFSAIVLLGSILEGILHSIALARWDLANVAISAPRVPNGKAVLSKEKWGLDGLLSVAKELGWIKEEAKILGDLLRDYRNLIHPAHHLKRGWAPNQASCHACFSAVYKAVDEIRDWLSENPLPSAKEDVAKE